MGAILHNMSSGSDNEEEYVEPPAAQLRDHVCVFGGVHLDTDELYLELKHAANQVVWAIDPTTQARVALVAVRVEIPRSRKGVRATFTFNQRTQPPVWFAQAAEVRYDFTVFDTRAPLVLDGLRVVMVDAAEIIRAASVGRPRAPGPRYTTPPRPARVTPPPIFSPLRPLTPAGTPVPADDGTQQLSQLSMATQPLDEGTQPLDDVTQALDDDGTQPLDYDEEKLPPPVRTFSVATPQPFHWSDDAAPLPTPPRLVPVVTVTAPPKKKGKKWVSQYGPAQHTPPDRDMQSPRKRRKGNKKLDL